MLSLGLTQIARSDIVRLDQTLSRTKKIPMTYSRKSDIETKFCTPVWSENGSIRQNCKFYYVGQTESDLYRKTLIESDRVRVRLSQTESDKVLKSETESDRVRQSQTESDKVHECDRVRQSQTKSERVRQSPYECDRVRQSQTKSDRVRQSRTYLH